MVMVVEVVMGVMEVMVGKDGDGSGEGNDGGGDGEGDGDNGGEIW